MYRRQMNRLLYNLQKVEIDLNIEFQTGFFVENLQSLM